MLLCGRLYAHHLQEFRRTDTRIVQILHLEQLVLVQNVVTIASVCLTRFNSIILGVSIPPQTPARIPWGLTNVFEYAHRLIAHRLALSRDIRTFHAKTETRAARGLVRAMEIVHLHSHHTAIQHIQQPVLCKDRAIVQLDTLGLYFFLISYSIFFPRRSICGSWQCFGISNSDSSVCNGHGSCASIDTCACNSGWSGANCTTTTCYSIPSSSPLACNGHGTCGGPDSCVCNSGYLTANCSTWACGIYLATDSRACGGNGVCISSQTCVCTNPNVTGVFCDEWSCYNISRTETSTVCSERGDCVAPDTCACISGYAGPTCNARSCFGVLSTNTSFVCGGHGTCTFPDLCTCTPGYLDANCSRFMCFGYNYTSPSACSGHGTCTAPGTCTCQSDYMGNVCQTLLCDVDCGSHGTCSGLTSCVCASGYSGLLCDTWSCANCSSHGTCTASETCTCATGYAGSSCTITACNGIPATNSSAVCFGHGNCTSPETCVCLPGFVGPYCQIFGSTVEQLTVGIIIGSIAIGSIVGVALGVLVLPRLLRLGRGYRKKEETTEFELIPQDDDFVD